MSDTELRELARAVAAGDRAAAGELARFLLRQEREHEATDVWVRHFVRVELVRLGRVDEAGLESGDVLEGGKSLDGRKRRWRVSALSPTGRRVEVVGIVCAAFFDSANWRAWPVDRIRILHGSDRINRGSKRLGRLIEPARPDTLRALESVQSSGAERRRQRDRVRRLLEATWAIGANEDETRAVLKAFAPHNPSFAWRAFWSEARDQTGNWGCGLTWTAPTNEPAAESAAEFVEVDMPLFQKGSAR